MVEIKELNLQIPGLQAEEGKQLGAQVAQRVAHLLPADLDSKYLENLDLQLSLPASVSRSRWAEVISDAVLRKIMEATR